jgi:transposase-like protein
MLKFMDNPALNPKLVACPFAECGAADRIGIHSEPERRYKCHACGRTFAASRGTPLYDLKYPVWVVALVLTLLAYGCAVPAIVAAFYLDERTVAEWQRRAGQHGEQIQDRLVCYGQVELGQVQADELCVKTQRGTVWVATAMSVFARLFLWGEVGRARSKTLIERVMAQVRAAAGALPQAVLFAVDGFAAYPKAILKHFYTRLLTGQRGRPAHQVWPDLHIVQVVKSRAGRKLTDIQRRVAHGCRARVDDLIAMSQVTFGLINTAFIERLNATCRARMPALARRTRHLAQTPQRLRAELFWTGVVYNFCTVHHSLAATPAMAAGLTEHVWSVTELLLLRPPPK